MGPHEREQHDDSQAVAPPAQSVPAELHEPMPLMFSGWHVPSVAAPTFTQLPLQQSLAAVQVSVFCLQNEEATQRLSLQSPEQHSPLPAHGLPWPRHVWPAGLAQRLLVQSPLQQSALTVHAPAVGLSGVQGFGWHLFW